MSDQPTLDIARTPVRQLSVFLENRVGAMMSLVRLLRDHQIEILGLALQEATELTILRMVLSDPEGAQALFCERGIPHTATTVLVVELHEGTQDLASCLSGLLQAEINIRSSYPLLNRPALGALLALHVEDAEEGQAALHTAGFKVLCQNDLSR
jgi:hypothetical protein